jgi:hypothetical protein
MEPLLGTATRAFQHLLRDQPTTAAKVNFGWQVAAGPALARAARVAWTGDGLLRVQPRSAAWRREIERARPLVASRLDHLLGDGVVRAIVIEPAADERG